MLQFLTLVLALLTAAVHALRYLARKNDVLHGDFVEAPEQDEFPC